MSTDSFAVREESDSSPQSRQAENLRNSLRQARIHLAYEIAKHSPASSGAMGVDGSGPRIRVTGRRHRACFSVCMPLVLQLHPALVVLCMFGVYAACCALFAAIYFAIGEECFRMEGDEFDFNKALWLSVHTFTTVGYGSIYPVCASAHVTVLAQGFVSVLAGATIGGRLFFEVMRPASKIRFSDVFLLDTSGHTPSLTFRLVRESGAVLRDAHVRVQAQILTVQPDGSVSGKRVELPLRSNFFSMLEQWQIYHDINIHSPLWSIRGDLKAQLHVIDVSLSVYDTAYMQEVRMYKSYRHTAFVAQPAKFVGMVEMHRGKGVDEEGELEIKHDLINAYHLLEGESGLRLPPSKLGHALKRAVEASRRSKRQLSNYAKATSRRMLHKIHHMDPPGHASDAYSTTTMGADSRSPQ
ncbi:hypothetical protein AB1Y20_021918 [Prymnesium parvum]|uniref:Potassium channel domain-containing protein n=1 Tax=Prymnesium parvum TaxID=97485 RepID=A0AB34JH84_PRYPA